MFSTTTDEAAERYRRARSIAMAENRSQFERVRLILLRDSDPLFVVKRQQYDEAREDEYDGYAREIANMLKRGSSYEEILGYLKWAETENMGLSYSEEKADAAAKLITAIP